MSYEPNAHDAQMAILKELLLAPAVSFAKLQKTTDLTSDHFNFHLKKLVEAGYVQKNTQGQYTLTPDGKEYANRMDTDQKILEKQAKVAVLLLVEDDKGRFLAQKRLKHPYYGFWGRMGGKIRWGETVLEAAARELMEETGLTADLEVRGEYHKMDYRKSDGSILEDKYFHVVHATHPRGTLQQKFDGGENHWLTAEEMAAKEKVFASAIQVADLVRQKGLIFVEMKHEYSDEEY